MPLTGDVQDAYNDPYAMKRNGRIKRSEFEKWKRTEQHTKWRRIQLEIQKNQCAYCRVDLTKKNIVTHIDHIHPLRFEGTNRYNNLLLSCRRCNMRKYVATNRVEPDWVKKNKEKVLTKNRLRWFRAQQAKQFHELVFQEQLGWEMRQKFGE